VVSNLLYALYEGGGLFSLMLYNTLHPRRYLGRPFIKTLHSLEGLMIIDSSLNSCVLTIGLCFARFRLQLYSCYFIIFASYTVISQLFVQR